MYIQLGYNHFRDEKMHFWPRGRVNFSLQKKFKKSISQSKYDCYALNIMPFWKTYSVLKIHCNATMTLS